MVALQCQIFVMKLMLLLFSVPYFNRAFQTFIILHILKMNFLACTFQSLLQI